MTRLCSSSSIRSSRADSASVSLNTGMPVAQALEDLDRLRDRRLGDLDGLEPALERSVLLQVLAVLIQRRRADRLQLTAGQHRLEDRRRVDRALGGARSDQRVQLVDEQDDV